MKRRTEPSTTRTITWKVPIPFVVAMDKAVQVSRDETRSDWLRRLVGEELLRLGYDPDPQPAPEPVTTMERHRAGITLPVTRPAPRR